MKVIDVPIDKIKVGDRYRRDLGDLEALAANIREMGLLQPIGVDEYFNLIYGKRRLDACEDLGWKHIPCVVVKLKSVIAGEYAENEFRKQFTVTERAAIGRAVEEELGDRRGERTDKLKENFPEVSKGQTRDIAATRAGFSNARTYDAAKSVVDRGARELVEAMDRGDVSIDAAAKIATQPKAEQVRIVHMPKDERREVVRHIRVTKADKEADEARARDIRLFRGLYNAVKFIGDFREPPADAWAGLWRVSAYDFADHLDKAIEYLPRLKKEHPNATKRPIKVS